MTSLKERFEEKFGAYLHDGVFPSDEELLSFIEQERQTAIAEERERVRKWAAANLCEGAPVNMAMEDVGRNFILLALMQFLESQEDKSLTPNNNQ